MKRLNEDHVKTYRTDGFLVLQDIVDPSQIAELRTVTEEMVLQSAGREKSDDVFDFGSGQGGRQLRRIKSPERCSPVYAGVMGADTILDCVADLLGHDIRFWSGKLNLKQPGGGQAVEWHQDWAFGPATNDDILTVGIPLDDATIENGCLFVLPGSHSGPVLDHWRGGQFVGAVEEAEIDPGQAVPLEVRAGGISVHHVRAVHGSAPNRSISQRRLLLYSYAAADAWPLSGVQDPAAFDRQMVRGSPTLAPRLEQVPVRPWPKWEEEELKHDTSIFDFQARVEKSAFG
jgi:phytanoyl-CoA hydroxylase